MGIYPSLKNSALHCFFHSGFAPLALAFAGRRVDSHQKIISGCPFGQPEIMEQMMGIEPTRPAWEAGVLPLNYIRILKCLHSIPHSMAKVKWFLVPGKKIRCGAGQPVRGVLQYR